MRLALSYFAVQVSKGTDNTASAKELKCHQQQTTRSLQVSQTEHDLPQNLKSSTVKPLICSPLQRLINWVWLSVYETLSGLYKTAPVKIQIRSGSHNRSFCNTGILKQVQQTSQTCVSSHLYYVNTCSPKLNPLSSCCTHGWHLSSISRDRLLGVESYTGETSILVHGRTMIKGSLTDSARNFSC